MVATGACVDRRDVKRGGRDIAVGRAVVHLPGDRAAGVGAEIGRVVAGRGVRNASRAAGHAPACAVFPDDVSVSTPPA